MVSGIIITMLALVLPDFRLGERQFALRRAGSQLVQDLRKAQGLSMSAAASYCPEGQRLKGYGLILESSAPNNTFYKLFAKCVNGVDVYSEKENTGRLLTRLHGRKKKANILRIFQKELLSEADCI